MLVELLWVLKHVFIWRKIRKREKMALVITKTFMSNMHVKSSNKIVLWKVSMEKAIYLYYAIILYNIWFKNMYIIKFINQICYSANKNTPKPSQLHLLLQFRTLFIYLLNSFFFHYHSWPDLLSFIPDFDLALNLLTNLNSFKLILAFWGIRCIVRSVDHSLLVKIYYYICF